MGNPLLQRQFVRLLDNRLKKVYVDKFDSLPLIIDNFYTTIDDEKAWVEYMSIGSIPDPEPFQGVVTYQSLYPGYHTKIEPQEYAGGIIIERKLLDDDQTNTINGRTKGLASAANRKMNKIAHEPFRYADSSAFTFMQSEEGVALCSNSHTTKAPDISTSTGFDNYSTLPFDAANLEALRIQSLQLRDDIGERYTTNFDLIIHPTSLAADVAEVVESQGKQGEENPNIINFQKGRWKSIELPYLDDWDTNNWFIADSSMMKESLIWHNRIPLEFDSINDFDTHMRKYADYFRIGWGYIEWRWIIGAFVG